MRLRLLLIAILMSTPLFPISTPTNEQNISTHALSPQEVFEKANQAYKAHNYTRARELYEAIPNKSAQVYYNLGNCAYKQEEYGYALLYWRRAEKSWGMLGRSELLENIFLLKKKLGIHQKHSIFRTFSLIRSIPLFVFQFLFLALWLFLFIYLRFLSKKQKKGIIMALFALIALFGILLVVRYSVDARRYGIVVETEAPLRSGPGQTFKKLATLPEADEVIIKKESDHFYKVKTEGRIGWVSTQDVKKI